MSCTTFLAGKGATYDGSTFVARNDDAGGGEFDAKKLDVVMPDEQPEHYQAVNSKFALDLPDDPIRYTQGPDASGEKGVWGQGGINAANVAMSATETITSNPRVLGADPLVADGFGEEDMVTIILPYIHSAREGVIRTGELLEKYGTYEMNGVAFQDVDEIWWLETIGGHHWIAKRVPDDQYVVMTNQMGIDFFDFADAFGEKQAHMCSADMPAFIEDHHLNLTMNRAGASSGDRNAALADETAFNTRIAFGSRDDSDHAYNTPRAWFAERYFNPSTYSWDGAEADFTPASDDIPWSLVPERKITIEDVKYVLSSHYQGTPFDPYGHDGLSDGRENSAGQETRRKKFRPIGINRTCMLSLTQIRPYRPEAIRSIHWVAFASNVFNALIPFYMNVKRMPRYVAGTTTEISTDSFYWMNRLIGALADAHMQTCIVFLERYQNAVHSKAHELLDRWDGRYDGSGGNVHELLEQANQEISDFVQEKTAGLLDTVLFMASIEMKNSFSRSDA